MSVCKNKYNAALKNRGQYSMTPNEIFALKGLDLTAKYIWLYIVSMPSDWDSSRNNIARNLEIHVDTVSKHIKTLKEFNMIKVTDGNRGAWNFEIVPPAEWTSTLTELNISPVVDCPAVQSEGGHDWTVPWSTTGLSRGPLLDCPVVHIQEDNTTRRDRIRFSNRDVIKDLFYPSTASKLVRDPTREATSFTKSYPTVSTPAIEKHSQEIKSDITQSCPVSKQEDSISEILKLPGLFDLID